MLLNIVNKLKDWWFERKHGCNRAEYAIRQWNKDNINSSASNIVAYFHGFKYVIKVDPNKVLDDHPMLGWCLKQEIREQFCYPTRELGDHLMYEFARGIEVEAEQMFDFNEFGYDKVFIATNNKNDAILIALKYK